MDLPRSCFILTGPKGSGKTLAMARILGELGASGRRVSALLQPDTGRRPDGAALGFELEFLTLAYGKARAERIALARVLGEGEMPAPALLVLGRFAFDRAAFRRARDFIASASRPESGGAELLGLDEIGKLELLRAEGLMPCLEAALAAVAAPGGPRALICSAREDCVAELSRMAQASGLRAPAFGLRREAEALDALRRVLEA